MNRRRFLRRAAQLSGGATLLASSSPCLLGTTSPQALGRPVVSRWVPSITLRDYLIQAAQQISARAATNSLPSSPAIRKQHQETKRRQFLEMMGLEAWSKENHPTPPVTVTGVVEREDYLIEKLHYQSLPGLHVTANLYLPRKRQGKAPAVLYVCGHASDQKVYYQAHARRFAQLGFVCLIAETIESSESRGYHHGCYREGWWHWYSRGYTPAGIELLNGIRALDLLSSRPEVDAERLGVTGISGGGAASWWIAAADERVKVAAPVCGTATLFSHIHDRTIDGHCDCMWWINTYQWDMADVGALIAPRPLLICSADKDEIFTIESIRQVHRQVERLYRKIGAAHHIGLIETPGGHSYHERSRTGIFSWFVKHLMDRDVPPSAVGDVDLRPESQESPETLKVYPTGSPPENRVRTIQDEFLLPPPPPLLTSPTSLTAERDRVVRALRQRTFGAFPKIPPKLDLQVEQEFEEAVAGKQFAFTPENGWRLRGQWFQRLPVGTARRPTAVALRSPAEPRGETRGFLMRLPLSFDGMAVDVRGVGDTGWDESLQWHARRAAAWTGRTLASMRVWDTLRALEAAESLLPFSTTPVPLVLAARGELCAVALYAALLHGGLRALILDSPPATQNASGAKDGRGPALEMLNCLQITDLPQVAGLLWPMELVILGDAPATYRWTEEVYQQMGAPGRITRLTDLRDWKPS